VRQPSDNVSAVIRPTWSGNAEQRKLLEDAVEVTAKADAHIEKAREMGWAAIIKAREAGVPDKVICERTGWSRATLNRKFGPRQ
jgi:hypothetical protein